jgi:hypothetical protein
MINLGIDLFNAVQAELSDAACTLTTEAGDSFNCLTDGVGFARSNSEIGLSYNPSIEIHITETSDPDNLLSIGVVVSATYRGAESKWRINETRNMAGLKRLVLAAVYG